MRLIKVYSDMPSFRTVNFNKAGLNFVVAKQKNPEVNKKGQTYNGVGKSLLVRIIHFCLGAKKEHYKIFCEKLPEVKFFVDFEIDSNRYTAERGTEQPNKIFLNDKELSIGKFNKKMASLCFELPEDIQFLSFRSLFSFFIRPKRESYMRYDSTEGKSAPYQKMLYNAFLLGLDVYLAQKKRDIKQEIDRMKNLEDNFKKDSLLSDFFTQNKDINLTIVDLEEQIKKLDNNLKNFKVAEDYHEVQFEADKIEKQLFTLNNKIIMLQNNIENINKNLKISPYLNKENIKNIYEESKIYFSENIAKTLDELENFYKNLTSNRKRRLIEQQNRLKSEMINKKSDAEKFTKKFNNLMQYLGEHQALDVFVNISNKNAQLKTELNSLKKYQEIKEECKIKKRKLKKEQMDLTEQAENHLKEFEPEIIGLRDYFRQLAKIFYKKSIAGLTIKNNDRNNQLRYNIDAKIESDASDGINNVKIFCYDLTLFFQGYNHKINFIFHDSRLFAGDIDERQKTDMFKTVYKKFNDSDKQYIATVNQNQLKEIKEHLKDEEYKNIIDNNTVLTLTDDKDSEKLLGIKKDLPDE